MIVGIPRAVVDVAQPVIGLLKEMAMGKQTKKTGKGVDALFEQEQQEKLAKRRADDARRKREKRAAARIERESSPFHDGDTPASQKRIAADQRATELRMLASLDDPAPVRLSVIILAKEFSESCHTLAEAERVFDQAVAARAKAKLALDAEIARMANEVG